jgi:uncharacterized membrane protein
MDAPKLDEALPAHIDDVIARIGRLHAEHRVGGTPVQKAVDEVTRFVSRPRAAAAIALIIVAWIGGNVAIAAWRPPAFDAPPFPWLQLGVAVAALFMTVFILISQRREDELTDLRAQLTLELAILTEQKSAKVIQLLEELRADLPQAPDRDDPEARELAKRAEPEAVMEALKGARDEAPADADDSA